MIITLYPKLAPTAQKPTTTKLRHAFQTDPNPTRRVSVIWNYPPLAESLAAESLVLGGGFGAF